MGGRGSGKTKAGAEWVRFCALIGGCGRIALVAPTLGDAREVMIEGVSGLRQICRPGEMAPEYQVSRRRLLWPNGAEAHVFSAEDPDSLRGPQFDAAWCDEAAAWSYGLAVWDMLQFGLRIGTSPRAVITTTPRPVPLIRKLVDDPSVAITRSATSDNADYLSPAFLRHVHDSYGGSELGRQELQGELLDNAEGALWTRGMIERAKRAFSGQDMVDVIVAVDPPSSVGPKADACGIIAAGVTGFSNGERRCAVLADATAQGLSPLDWAGRVVALARSAGANRIVAEANQGGEMVRTILQSAGCTLPVVLKHAHLSKRARAMPVAVLYEQDRVLHAGGLDALETEMLSFGTDGLAHSPDRVDALVWAVGALMVQPRCDPRIRRL